MFTHQKYARKQVKGQKVSITRAKAVDQICDVMRIFIETVSESSSCCQGFAQY